MQHASMTILPESSVTAEVRTNDYFISNILLIICCQTWCLPAEHIAILKPVINDVNLVVRAKVELPYLIHSNSPLSLKGFTTLLLCLIKEREMLLYQVQLLKQN